MLWKKYFHGNFETNENNHANTALIFLGEKMKAKKFAVSDIEGANWIKFLCIGHYDGKNYRHFLSLDTYFDYAFTHEVSTIFCHFGGIYDFLFLIGHILDNPNKYEFRGLIPRGSGILCFKAYSKIHEKQIQFNDSSALLPFSLKSLADNFDVETKKGEIDHKKTKKVTKKILAYMKDDHLALYQVLEKFTSWELIAKHGWKSTLASQSLHIFKKEFSKKTLLPLGRIHDEFCRKAYFGGRTEIFKMVYNDRRKKLNVYDINSLYPFCMNKLDTPTTFKFITKTFLPKDLGIYHCIVKSPDKMHIPILGTKINGKFIFPLGEFEGHWCSNELNYAIKHGYKITTVFEGRIFNNGGKIFKPFVQYFYKKRIATNKPAEKIVLKLILNSLYGRMGMDLEKEQLHLEKRIVGEKLHSLVTTPSGKTYRFTTTEDEIDSFSHVAIGAFITAQARIELYECFKKVNYNVYNCDTDSVFTPEKMKTGNGLGELKLEYQLDKAVFLLPKTYLLENKNMKKIAMKGFDKKKIQHFQFKDFITALEGDLKILNKKGKNPLSIKTEPRMNRFKTALKKGSILNMSNAGEKAIRSKYTKRIVNSDFSTTAHTFNTMEFDFKKELLEYLNQII